MTTIATNRRLRREKRTLQAMVRLFCGSQHSSDSGPLCSDCQRFLSYAEERLDRCQFAAAKPACADCVVHCFRPTMREYAKRMMRYAGPRMIRRHPLLALLHVWDKRVARG